MNGDNDGLIAGASVAGLGLAALAAYLVTRDDANDIAQTIRDRADSATNPATGIFEEDLGSGPLGTGGIVSPDDVPADSPLSPYELELADTDTGE